VNKENLTPKGILGSDPNEKWLNLGFYTVAAGVLSLLGINIGGVEVGTPHAQYAPWLIILLGGASMYYGTELKKNKIIADKIHELDMADKRKSDRVKPEATRGNIEFLAWFSKQTLPITVVELSKKPFPYDEKRSKAELAAALRSSRAEFWVNNGKIKKFGDTYELRDDDRTVIG